MKQVLKRFARKLRALEARRETLASEIDRAHSQNDVTGVLSLEAQYQEVMHAIVRMRGVLHMYNFRVIREVPHELSQLTY